MARVGARADADDIDAACSKLCDGVGQHHAADSTALMGGVNGNHVHLRTVDLPLVLRLGDNEADRPTIDDRDPDFVAWVPARCPDVISLARAPVGINEREDLRSQHAFKARAHGLPSGERERDHDIEVRLDETPHRGLHGSIIPPER
jgi:hypothetical protein